MKLESHAEGEGPILVMTTNEPDEVHLGQCMGESQAHKEQAAKERRRVCCLGSQILSLKE